MDFPMSSFKTKLLKALVTTNTPRYPSDKIPLKKRKQNSSITLPLVLRWTVNQDGKAKDEMD